MEVSFSHYSKLPFPPLNEIEIQDCGWVAGPEKAVSWSWLLTSGAVFLLV